eukprot:CAMPEP_0201489876 /NCGR_PEP_ID=MMETSP0151_2-20130828/24036_1 /ASSEMBLY_ACC=CAM_ASM_000257 /TAXON_ID=200890 /ORGANISM="Paramoeba atlantica, Strain 621/1 / CCAP 1560/9" /LENGTH=174 /DNA_ID=CAMNT_0047875601 /DNA_START=56 /DNA_END=580 /DNA_ORIENTATION=+
MDQGDALFEEKFQSLGIDLTAKYFRVSPINTVEDAEIVAKAIPLSEIVTEINFYKCGLDDQKAKIIIPALKHCPKLTAVHFSNNLIGDEGAKVLAEELCQNETLTQIYIWVNQISNSGFEELYNALLYHNTTVTLFDSGSVEFRGKFSSLMSPEGLEERKKHKESHFVKPAKRD